MNYTREQLIKFERAHVPNGTPWAQWKADRLNDIFMRYRHVGQPAPSISAATIRHGERTKGKG